MTKITTKMFEDWLKSDNKEVTEFFKINQARLSLKHILGSNSNQSVFRHRIIMKIENYIELNFRQDIKNIDDEREIIDFKENMYCYIADNLKFEFLFDICIYSLRFDFNMRKYFSDAENNVSIYDFWKKYVEIGNVQFTEEMIHDELIRYYQEYVDEKIQIYSEYFKLVRAEADDLQVADKNIICSLSTEEWKTKYAVLCVDFKEERVFIQKLNSDEWPLVCWFISLDLEALRALRKLFQNNPEIEHFEPICYNNLLSFEKDEIVERVLRETNE